MPPILLSKCGIEWSDRNIVYGRQQQKLHKLKSSRDSTCIQIYVIDAFLHDTCRVGGETRGQYHFVTPSSVLSFMKKKRENRIIEFMKQWANKTEAPFIAALRENGKNNERWLAKWTLRTVWHEWIVHLRVLNTNYQLHDGFHDVGDKLSPNNVSIMIALLLYNSIHVSNGAQKYYTINSKRSVDDLISEKPP